MIGEVTELADGQPLACDVCIAGAGAAGLTLALALTEDSRRRVVVLEGGGREFEPESQDLYRGRNVGRDYFPLDECRLRFLGGTTNHWGGTCTPLSPLDFQARAWVPHSGWPIGPDDLARYYEPANRIVGVRSTRYDAPESGAQPLPAFDPARIETRLYRQSEPPYRPHEVHGREIEARPGLHLLLHASLVRVQLAPDANSVVSFRVRGPDGRTVEVQARSFVVALGGIETPRLLLASNDVATAGVGNGRDLVGRFFQEHAFVQSLGTCHPSNGWYRHMLGRTDAGSPYKYAIVNAPALQEREGVLNCALSLDMLDTEAMLSPGYRASRSLGRELRHGEVRALTGDVWSVLTRLGSAIQGRREARLRPLGLVAQVEQAPDPDSRVTLDAETDPLGLPRVALDWRLGEIEKRTMRTALLTLAAELGRLGLGRVEMQGWLAAQDLDFGPDMAGAYHHIGTARMGDTPATGVVDRDCRVHGVGNLYLAGSSVFPTGGWANPTLTIVALALRLAEHLEAALA